MRAHSFIFNVVASKISLSIKTFFCGSQIQVTQEPNGGEKSPKQNTKGLLIFYFIVKAYCKKGSKFITLFLADLITGEQPAASAPDQNENNKQNASSSSSSSSDSGSSSTGNASFHVACLSLVHNFYFKSFSLIMIE
jgi:hypothetical protein